MEGGADGDRDRDPHRTAHEGTPRVSKADSSLTGPLGTQEGGGQGMPSDESGEWMGSKVSNGGDPVRAHQAA